MKVSAWAVDEPNSKVTQQRQGTAAADELS